MSSIYARSATRVITAEPACAADYESGEKNWPIMWNEFEVLDVQRFRQPDIKHFAAATDATHRLYTHRHALVLQQAAHLILCGDQPAPSYSWPGLISTVSPPPAPTLALRLPSAMVVGTDPVSS